MLFEEAPDAYVEDKRERVRRSTMVGCLSAAKLHLLPRRRGVETQRWS